MSYTHQRQVAIVVAVLLAGIAFIQAADPAEFGLTPVMVRWFGVVSSMLGVAATFLPSVRGMGTNPDFLANRVSELPVHDRDALITDVQDRAGQRLETPAVRVPTVAEIADELERRRSERVQARLRGETTPPPAPDMPISTDVRVG